MCRGAPGRRRPARRCCSKPRGPRAGACSASRAAGRFQRPQAVRPAVMREMAGLSGLRDGIAVSVLHDDRIAVSVAGRSSSAAASAANRRPRRAASTESFGDGGDGRANRSVMPGTEMRGTLLAARRGRLSQRGSESKSGSASGPTVAVSPPLLTPPHKGEGDFAAFAHGETAAGPCAARTPPSPLWGGVRGGGKRTPRGIRMPVPTPLRRIVGVRFGLRGRDGGKVTTKPRAATMTSRRVAASADAAA